MTYVPTSAITHEKRLEIVMFLKGVLTKGNDGLYRFQPGWNDGRVAAECQIPDSAIITTIRIRAFGRESQHVKQRRFDHAALDARLTRAIDPITRRYRSPTESDQTIADEFGISRPIVCVERIRLFGTIIKRRWFRRPREEDKKSPQPEAPPRKPEEPQVRTLSGDLAAIGRLLQDVKQRLSSLNFD